MASDDRWLNDALNWCLSCLGHSITTRRIEQSDLVWPDEVSTKVNAWNVTFIHAVFWRKTIRIKPCLRDQTTHIVSGWEESESAIKRGTWTTIRDGDARRKKNAKNHWRWIKTEWWNPINKKPRFVQCKDSLSRMLATYIIRKRVKMAINYCFYKTVHLRTANRDDMNKKWVELIPLNLYH